jgi:CheY-like chemotaxis protein
MPPATGAACCRFVSGCGCDVETAANSAECVALLGPFWPDVVALDLKLLSGGAARVLRWLHRVGARQPVPTVVLTAYASSESVPRSPRPGGLCRGDPYCKCNDALTLPVGESDRDKAKGSSPGRSPRGTPRTGEAGAGSRLLLKESTEDTDATAT